MLAWPMRVAGYALEHQDCVVIGTPVVGPFAVSVRSSSLFALISVVVDT